MKKLFWALCFMALLISCKDVNKGFQAGYENAQNDAAIADSIAQNTIELYAFDGGSIMAHNKNLFAQGKTYKGDSIKLADAFYVIKHPKGILIWDTGLPEKLVGKAPYTTPDGSFTLSREDSIVDQLAMIGIVPRDVDFIGLSHIHFDHTGGANHFGNATWLVQQSTLDFMSGDSIKGNDFYDRDSFSELKNRKIIADSDYDVFGDGRVVIKYLPGHTAGHSALFLNLAEAGPIVLSGDTYHFRQNREDTIVPQFNYSIPESETSIESLEDFVEKNHAAVIIQHDPEDFKKITKAPKPIR